MEQWELRYDIVSLEVVKELCSILSIRVQNWIKLKIKIDDNVKCLREGNKLVDSNNYQGDKGKLSSKIKGWEIATSSQQLFPYLTAV